MTGSIRGDAMRGTLAIFLAALAAGTGAIAQTAPTVSATHSKGIRIIHPGEAGTNDPIAPTAATSAPAPSATASQSISSAVDGNCARPLNATDLRLGNDARSASLLAARLRQGRAVGVDLAEPYALKAEAPAPLNSWLAAVKASGGTVDVVPYCQTGTKGIFSRLFAHLSPNDPGKAYRAAKTYNVVLHNDVRAKTITQVEFAPRAAVKRQAH